MIKHPSNTFLATRISFGNEIGSICEALGANFKEVATAMAYARLIGHAFPDAGVGRGYEGEES